MGFPSDEKIEQAAEIILKLYQIFMQHDATLLEINPMVESTDGKGDD